MNSSAKIIIDKTLLKENIDNLKTNFINYNGLIISLKNNALNHGYSIVNLFANLDINNFSVNNLNEALKVRKYNNSVNIIISEEVDLDCIYDAINNNFTIRIYSLDYLKKLNVMNIKDTLKVELLICTAPGTLGLNTKENVQEAYNLICDNEHIRLDSVTSNTIESSIDTSDYDLQVKKFKYLLGDLVNQDINIYLSQKSLLYKKISFINMAYLDTFAYGLNPIINYNWLDNLKIKQNLKKLNLDNKINNQNLNLKSIFSIETYIFKIINLNENDNFYNYKFEEKTRVGILPIGKDFGLDERIKYVTINKMHYQILKTISNYTYIIIDNNVKENDSVKLLKDNLNDVCGIDPIKYLHKFNPELPYFYE
jgi:alanine racemase